MYNDYHITLDSFGQTCPANWQEIADHLNAIIDATPDITDPDTGDVTPEGREQVNAIWERYCAGDMPDAPAPVFDDTADKPAKKSYDLILTSKGPTPMRAGTHEEISGLSLSPYDPNNYIIHESPRAIYRIHKHDAEKSDIKRFLQRADKLPPRE